MKIFNKTTNIICVLSLFLFSGCESNNKDSRLIKSLDPTGIKQKYFNEYDMQIKHFSDSTRVLYRFKNDSSITIAEFEFEIFKTEQEAVDGMLSYLTSISMVMDDGKDDFDIGEEIWWGSSTGNIQDISNIAFRRYNINIMIYSKQSLIDLISISKEMDNDIINGFDYITYENI